MVDESKGYKETRQFDGSALDLKLISYSARRESFTFIVTDCRSPRIGWLTKARYTRKWKSPVPPRYDRPSIVAAQVHRFIVNTYYQLKN